MLLRPLNTISAFRALSTFPTFAGVELSLRDKIFHVQLNRPKAANSLSIDTLKGITDALNFANAHQESSITVLSGTGKYFCSGFDLRTYPLKTADQPGVVKKFAEDLTWSVRDYTRAFIDHDKPLVALCNGPAIGGGATPLALCDMVIVSDTFYALFPFSRLAVRPELASTYTFPAIMGPMRAAEVLLSGRPIPAAEARELGLVSQVVQHDKFEEVAWKRAEDLSRFPAGGLKSNKKLLRDVHRAQMHAANEKESLSTIPMWSSQECQDALAAHLAAMKK